MEGVNLVQEHDAYEVYKPLAHTTKQIRLARFLPSTSGDLVRITLETVDLEAKPIYEALSYVWGNENETTPIETDGQIVQVTTNLEAALHQIQSEEQLHGQETRALEEDEDGFAAARITLSLRLWADAICINQRDQSEKSSQVAMMPEIFHGAFRVRAWLGRVPSAPSVARAFRRLYDQAMTPEARSTGPRLETFFELGGAKRAKQRFDFRKQLFGMLKNETADAFTDLIRHAQQSTYWTRKWIIQELALAKRIRLYFSAEYTDLEMGDDHTHWADLTSFLRLIADWDWHDHPHPQGMSRRRVYLAFSKSIERLSKATTCVQQRHEALTAKYYTSALQGIFEWRQAQASEPLDCVFAIQGMLPESWRLALDYGISVPALFTAFAVGIARATKSLTILEQAYSNVSDLPSWVPDLRVPGHSLDWKTHPGLTSLVKTADFVWNEFEPLILTVPGVIVDEIAVVPTVSATPPRTGNEWIRYVYETWAAHYKAKFGSARSLGDSESFWNTVLPGRRDLLRKLLLAIVRYNSEIPREPRILMNRAFEKFRDERILFFTTSGRIGYAEKNLGLMKEGDKLLIIASVSPISGVRLASTSPKKTYKLINQCFVDGLMKGEGVEEIAERGGQQNTSYESCFEDVHLV